MDKENIESQISNIQKQLSNIDNTFVELEAFVNTIIVKLDITTNRLRCAEIAHNRLCLRLNERLNNGDKQK